MTPEKLAKLPANVQVAVQSLPEYAQEALFNAWNPNNTQSFYNLYQLLIDAQKAQATALLPGAQGGNIPTTLIGMNKVNTTTDFFVEYINNSSEVQNYTLFDACFARRGTELQGLLPVNGTHGVTSDDKYRQLSASVRIVISKIKIEIFNLSGGKPNFIDFSIYFNYERYDYRDANPQQLSYTMKNGEISGADLPIYAVIEEQIVVNGALFMYGKLGPNSRLKLTITSNLGENAFGAGAIQ